MFLNYVLAFIGFFTDITTHVFSATQIACDAVRVQHILQYILYNLPKKNFFL